MKALYVTDRSSVGDERFLELLDTLAGAPELTVQLREREASDREGLEWARRARERLGPATPLYVNGRFDIALAAGAAGVHLPSSGLPLARVRANTPRGFHIGVSTHSAAEACEAIESGADLVVIGPIFETPSKLAYGAPLGSSELARLPPRSSQAGEVYAIGGIDEDRLAELDAYRDRISGVAAIRLFQEAADPSRLAERLAAR
ncbi:MAG TPA: thiamine phosphate synthase [Thermoanaerobaculia bacterium]|jgi:thiamine-phosphate pyrophosphorylase